MNRVQVKLSEIHLGQNPRQDVSGVKELAESIKSVGLLQPVVLRYSVVGDGTEKRHVLVDGSRRLRALKELKVEEVAAVIIDEGDADEAQMSANLCRQDLNVIERGRGYSELMRRHPARYNAVSIAKMYGKRSAQIQALVDAVRRIDTKHDAILVPVLSELGFDGLIEFSRIPAAKQPLLAAQLARRGGNLNWAMQDCFNSLSYMSDAVNSERLVSEGKAFRVGKSIYTDDKKVYDEAKKAYEAQSRKQYGAPEKERQALSEKAKAAEKKKKEDQKKRRVVASEFVREELKMILTKEQVQEPDRTQRIEALGIELCERHLKSDTSRTLLSIFGVKETKSGQYGDLPRQVWRTVFAAHCKTPASLVQLHAFLSFKYDWQKMSAVEGWAAALKKIGGAK